MSISRQNLSIVIVTLKSDKVIYDCIDSIEKEIPIIVVENSSNNKFKEKLESQYKNVTCILSKANLGMGTGNNIGIKYAKTNYVMILNPDVILEENTLENIFLASKEISDFSILSPLSADINFPNYKILDKKKNNKIKSLIFEVDYVDGFAMLINKSKFVKNIYFDENIFMYLENDDLCLQVNKRGGLIFVISTSKINHLGANTVDLKYKSEIELSRNWHWLWSKYYFNKKNFSTTNALIECLPTVVSSLLKYFLYLVLGNKFKRKKYLNRVSGFYSAILGKASWYRPKFDD